ncbi:NUDIX domain-containing protein [Planomonospora alba]|uniref:NUDIX domain-containing protein n=1 Tax=Planomonospora alba TaxID=161354 RepID=UPI003CD0934B
MGASVPLRNGAGEVLPVDPACGPGFGMPGGPVGRGGPPRAAARREVAQELGPVVDRVPPRPGRPHDGVISMYDGGTGGGVRGVTAAGADRGGAGSLPAPPLQRDRPLRLPGGGGAADTERPGRVVPPRRADLARLMGGDPC